MSITFSLYQIFSIIGIPSIFTILGWIYKRVKDNDEETLSVKLGIQALLRSEMIDTYNKWFEKGYAPIYARESFENCYKQYHKLGANGVMDDIHDKFMELPIEKHKSK